MNALNMIEYVAVTGVDMHGIVVEEKTLQYWKEVEKASYKNEVNSSGKTEIELALEILKVGSVKDAAVFLCGAGWSVEAAVVILCS